MPDDYLAEHSTLYHGDALKLLPRLRPDSVRLVLADPPYGVSRRNDFKSMNKKGDKPGVVRRSINWDWDKDFDQIGWLKLAAPAVMKGGSFIIWNSWRNLGPIADELERLGFKVMRDLVWTKANPFPRNIERCYVQSREYALWAVRADRFHPWPFNRRKDTRYERGEFKYPVQHSDHHCKKPNGLFQELIELHTHPGELVVDPFLGSGTTAIAAYHAGRRCIGFERDEKYYNLAVTELTKEVGQENITRWFSEYPDEGGPRGPDPDRPHDGLQGTEGNADEEVRGPASGAESPGRQGD